VSLIKRIQSLRFKYLLQAGKDPDFLFIPKSRTSVKDFAEQIVRELGADTTGSAALVYHNLTTGEAQMQLCDMFVRLYDGHDIGVGCDEEFKYDPETGLMH
jgi:hypothetical protein